jgi:hypothetical protein
MREELMMAVVGIYESIVMTIDNKYQISIDVIWITYHNSLFSIGYYSSVIIRLMMIKWLLIRGRDKYELYHLS